MPPGRAKISLLNVPGCHPHRSTSGKQDLTGALVETYLPGADDPLLGGFWKMLEMMLNLECEGSAADMLGYHEARWLVSSEVSRSSSALGLMFSEAPLHVGGNSGVEIVISGSKDVHIPLCR